MALSTRTIKMLSPKLLAEKAGSVSGVRPNPIRVDREDQRFKDLYASAGRETLGSRQRCFILYQLALQSAAVEGDVAEVGVYRGGTAWLLGELTRETGKQLHLFDTFSGMPATDPERDKHQAGDFSDTSLAAVRSFVGDREGIHYHPGLFPETAEPVAESTFSLVHIDADIYSSVVDSCEFFFPRLAPGGMMLFDDYGFRSCPGAREAVDDFLLDRPGFPIYLPTGQALLLKS
jgi:O-methyltransferase